MAGAKEIRRKIASIKNTGKITKAMELISTVKMKKAQDSVMSKKDFVMELLKIFIRIEDALLSFPLFSYGSGNKTLAIIITGNKGLCGGYNVGVMKKVNSYMKETKEELDFVTVGKKAANFVTRTGNNLIADFSHDYSDHIKPIFTKRISRMLKDEFMTGKYNKVVVFYSHFLNTIKQIPISKEFLPISSKDIKEYLSLIATQFYDVEKEIEKSSNNTSFYKVEPSKEELAEHIIPIVLDMMFYDLLLESKASEHSSRMVAMKSAKDNAKKIADNLTLKYNKARQSIITKEVSEITAGVESLKD